MVAADCYPCPLVHSSTHADAGPWFTPGSPPFLPCLSRAGCMPGLGIQGPDSWARLAECWQADGCRPQTRQEVGAVGETWLLAQGGNLALEEKEPKLPAGFTRRLGELGSPSTLSSSYSMSPCRVDSWLLGQCGSSWVATTSLPSFGFLGCLLCPGEGLFSDFLEIL
jgi:hypothetical protein